METPDCVCVYIKKERKAQHLTLTENERDKHSIEIANKSQKMKLEIHVGSR